MSDLQGLTISVFGTIVEVFSQQAMNGDFALRKVGGIMDSKGRQARSLNTSEVRKLIWASLDDFDQKAG